MRTISSSERECGYRSEGGVYLVSEGSEFGSLPLWVSINPPIPCEDRYHRGPVLVNASAVLERRPEEAWFVGTSADHRAKVKADEWAIDRFGMTTYMRLHYGVCKGLGGVDEAMELLLGSVRWNEVHVEDAIRGLTEAGVPEIPRVAPHFAAFIEHIHMFSRENSAQELVSAAAAIWRMARYMTPKKYRVLIPYLMRVLTVLGLGKDAIAMRKRYDI
jgi:hypothetical protein